ncbi:sulfate/molybdate ABC transporter ATP-binding protein [Arthrobacter zhaoguopingii]|uniref:sulfate/molybdate ABC transporter ATP-binding protein n=1 Tax=Arthrobacter zhaoguopingii TaxID=2681491 RepID=UPI0013578D02|nr:ATP-binding cassette domain-containing protein [Arthrobacter zhaoguopingii]
MGFALQAAVHARGFDVALSMGDGETLAVLGPNGAGKSTLLALAAGLLRADTGSAELDGRSLFGPRSFLPPHRRGVCLLPQDPLLFPHLSVLDNVAFAPRSAGESRVASRASARGWLAEVEASELADKRPGQLSGGQAQRVAVARALAARPSLLLLDEPLASIDAAAAPGLRRMLRRVLAGRNAVIVTHDLLDALILADNVTVLEEGRIAETGSTQSVLERPRSSFAAGLAGLNFVPGTSVPSGLVDAAGRRLEAVSETPLPAGVPAAAVFSPRAVSVFPAAPAGSPRNVLRVSVTDLEPHGEFVTVRAGHLSAEISTSAAAELDLVPGSEVWFTVKATAVTLYPL